MNFTYKYTHNVECQKFDCENIKCYDATKKTLHITAPLFQSSKAQKQAKFYKIYKYICIC